MINRMEAGLFKGGDVRRDGEGDGDALSEMLKALPNPRLTVDAAALSRCLPRDLTGTILPLSKGSASDANVVRRGGDGDGDALREMLKSLPKPRSTVNAAALSGCFPGGLEGTILLPSKASASDGPNTTNEPKPRPTVDADALSRYLSGDLKGTVIPTTKESTADVPNAGTGPKPRPTVDADALFRVHPGDLKGAKIPTTKDSTADVPNAGTEPEH